MKSLVCSAAAALIQATFNLSAATLYVSLDSPNPVPPYATWATAATNIQDAVDAAVAGDEIVVTNGVYATGGAAVTNGILNRVLVNKPVTVRSVNGPSETVIKGERGDYVTGVRCVRLSDGAVLSGFTLTDAGIWGTFDSGGSGVWCQSRAALVTNCTLSGNSAGLFGGGAYGGTLISCTLTGNWARNMISPARGGGAYGSTLENCTLIGNSSDSQGGGAYGGTLNNCMLSGNSAGDGGGAYGGTLNNCTLSDNSASTGSGGGAYNCTLHDCRLIGNGA